VERFQPDAENRGVQLTLETSEQTRVGSVSVDAGRIEQILNNLISNALRHTPSGGAVLVRMQRMDGWVEILVVDTGSGIPQEALPRLFERFFRADKSRSRGEGGTGLGLAIARQLALAHGGDLSAANRPEGGAAFSLRLPAA
jgi:two-component system sensor histidine kinase BaeS